MVIEKRPTLTDNEHAHDIEPDQNIPEVQVLDEVGRHQPFKCHTVSILYRESLAAVLCDQTRDEDQVVFVASDEVDKSPPKTEWP